MFKRKESVPTRKRNCKLCRFDQKVDYKDVKFLERYIDQRGKILPRSFTGVCAKHQRAIAKEIKRSRILAFLPFTR